jgi:hypothetical protein
VGELLIGELTHFVFKRVDQRHNRGKVSDLLALAGAQNFGERVHNGQLTGQD